MGIAFLLDHTKPITDFDGDDYAHAVRDAFEYAKKNHLLGGLSEEEYWNIITRFVDDKKKWTKEEFDMYKRFPPHHWWENVANNKEYKALRPLAERIFSINTSSAAIERIWSCFKFFHSYLRNKLSEETVNKLVFIYANMDRGKKRMRDIYYLLNPGEEDVVDDEPPPTTPSFPSHREETPPVANSQRVGLVTPHRGSQRTSEASPGSQYRSKNRVARVTPLRPQNQCHNEESQTENPLSPDYGYNYAGSE